MVRATAALLLLLRDAEAAYIAVVGPTGDDVIVTDLTPVRLQLNDDESYGLLYEDGKLLTELPHKNWVATHFPPCAMPPISRGTAANVALKRPRAGAVTLTSLKCDGSAPDDYDVARIASVADATDVAGCEDVTGAGAKVVDAFHLLDEWDMVRTRSAELAGVVDAHVLVEADRFHDGMPRAGAEFWRDVAADWAFPGAAPVVNLTVRTWPPEAGEDDGDLHDRGEASRNGVLEALRAFGPALGLEATDVVVVSDVDEIPNRETVRRLKVAAECDKRRIAEGLLPVLATPASLLMSHHHYALEWTLGGRWAGPFAARLADLLGATAEGDAFAGGAAVFEAEFGVGDRKAQLKHLRRNRRIRSHWSRVEDSMSTSSRSAAEERASKPYAHIGVGLRIRCPRRLVGDGGADGFVDVVSAGPFAAPRARGLEHAGVGSSFEHLESFDVATPVPAPTSDGEPGPTELRNSRAASRRSRVGRFGDESSALVDVSTHDRRLRVDTVRPR